MSSCNTNSSLWSIYIVSFLGPRRKSTLVISGRGNALNLPWLSRIFDVSGIGFFSVLSFTSQLIRRMTE